LKLKAIRLYPALEKYIGDLTGPFSSIPEKRKKDLEKISDFISRRLHKGEPAKLTFICTHNSRRSHMGQIWAQTAAAYFGLSRIETFSGGTEATAFHPSAVEAMQNAGFQIVPDEYTDNPVYTVMFSETTEPIKAFSKKFDDKLNPDHAFCAIMTCADADENCPYIPGAALRIPITYEDPKAFDHTGRQKEAYEERCYQIGIEMFYLFSKVSKD
jgi:protein-tyrosine-phosphatase